MIREKSFEQSSRCVCNTLIYNMLHNSNGYIYQKHPFYDVK